MNQHDFTSDWHTIEQKLKQETKATLIETLKELTAVSPQVHRFLHVRYLHIRNMPTRIKPYQQQIDAQFESDEPDLSQVQQVVQNYQLATGSEEKGTAELWVYALESAAGFMRGTGLQDWTYQSDLIDLAWEYVYFLGKLPICIHCMWSDCKPFVAGSMNRAMKGYRNHCISLKQKWMDYRRIFNRACTISPLPLPPYASR